MSSPLNILWKKEETSGLYVNIFSIVGHEVDLDKVNLMRNKLGNEAYENERFNRIDESNNLLDNMNSTLKRFSPREPILSFEQHTQFTGVANCLEIQKNDEFGYHVIATRDLHVGQTVLVEPSYAITKSLTYEHNRCWNCYKNLQNHISCDGCADRLLCNEDRLTKSLQLSSMSIKETTDLAEKLLIKVFVAFTDVDSLMNTVEALLNGDDVPDLNATQKNFCSLFNLIHKHEVAKDQQFKLHPSANTFVVIMKMFDFKNTFNTEQRQRFLQHLILHLHHIAEYAIDLHEFKQNEIDEPIRSHTFAHFASAVYPFGCYLKHSCVPNVCWFAIDNRFICKVIRPIKRNEQVLRSYQ